MSKAERIEVVGILAKAGIFVRWNAPLEQIAAACYKYNNLQTK